MPVPDYQSLMRPVLEILSSVEELPATEIRERVADLLELSESDRAELTPSGQKPLYHNRTGWALSYLKQAGVLDRPRRGVYRISERGKSLLAQHPDRVDNDVLENFEEFREFLNRASPKDEDPQTTPKAATGDDQDDQTPDELLENAYRRLRSAIETDLLQQAKAASPAFFERLVVELLVAMGYGGSLKDAGRAIGKSGDGGIDGIIKEDRLGLDVIHVQAKRWGDKTVGRPDIQSFAGSLDGVRAKKGIFMTTSSFSKDAWDYVDRIDKRIVLIDGDQLVSLMYEFGIGVTAAALYAVKRVDSDYFGEE